MTSDPELQNRPRQEMIEDACAPLPVPESLNVVIQLRRCSSGKYPFVPPVLQTWRPGGTSEAWGDV